MKSKRKVQLALPINTQYFVRGVVRCAREHDWYLVADMMYTGRVPLGWRGDGILTILGYRKGLAGLSRIARRTSGCAVYRPRTLRNRSCQRHVVAVVATTTSSS
jgi:hypothetical protein